MKEKIESAAPGETRQGGVLPQQRSQQCEKLNKISPPPENLETVNPEENCNNLPPIPPTKKPRITPPRKLSTRNPDTRIRRFCPGIKGGEKWREINNTRGGTFALVTVVDKGIEISSKIKNMKTGKNLETNALNRKLCEVVYDERRKSVTSLESSHSGQ